MGDTCGCGCTDSVARDPRAAARAEGRRAIASDETVEGAMRRAPRAGEILRGLGIDICCGGRLTLAQAAASAGVPVAAVLEALAAGGRAAP
jgi:hypothetical protein